MALDQVYAKYPLGIFWVHDLKYCVPLYMQILERSSKADLKNE